ncbi:hypothetical protein [Dyella nitratireducens]|uniref:Lipoprotein n=1 Tax=Dyella nitratireducens TaxID=1849580 RepID=A0ABQ1G6H8_9GAMM|nr:hypothetical protein [Dyella nitratireducens]GGA37710.1 hypothetical protein GCM10010981_28560 [Dyella nitratireducens]GLQ40215.1 hypothetical protein GCM10007902_00640 [Dyella nitratireducens]
MTKVKKIMFGGRMIVVMGLAVSSVSCTNSVFVESKDITKGEIGGFAIGMSKQHAMEIAQQEHVHSIRPLLNVASVYNYSNSETLLSLGEGRSIELDNGRDLKVVYTVARCKVANVRTIGRVDSPFDTPVGTSVNDLIVELKKALNENHSLSAREVVSSGNGTWFVVDQAKSKESGTIFAYDVWSFEVTAIKPAGAEFVVYFSEGLIDRITYKRPRIRIE